MTWAELQTFDDSPDSSYIERASWVAHLLPGQYEGIVRCSAELLEALGRSRDAAESDEDVWAIDDRIEHVKAFVRELGLDVDLDDLDAYLLAADEAREHTWRQAHPDEAAALDADRDA